MISFKHKGNFEKTTKFLNKLKQIKVRNILNKYGPEGISILSNATPYDSGLTANSWNYSVEINSKGGILSWSNSNINAGQIIAILIQYGHGTGSGGYVLPNDYINPAIKPLFDKIAEEIWEEVIRA